MASSRTDVQEEEQPGREFHLPHDSHGWHVIRSANVLGSAGFRSGYHSWDVYVGHNQRWSVGVYEDIYGHTGHIGNEFWALDFYEDQYKAVSSSQLGSDEETSDSDEGISEPQRFEDRTLLSVNLKPRRIRVQLDWDRGRLSFSDPDSNELLHTFTHTFRHDFTEKLLPCIYNGVSNSDNGIYLKMVQGPEEQKVQKSLEVLKEKLRVFRRVRTKYLVTENHIKVQARSTERQIKEQFENLHRFLQEEEEARMAALREEEAQKSQEMKERMEALCRDMETLSNAIQAAEDQLRAEDHVSFLQNYESSMQGLQHLTLQGPPTLSGGALIDQAKHLKNLTFAVWDKMKDIVSFTPVVLDPNTAGPCLWLSDDLTTVRSIEKHQLPDNPERFQFFRVQGSEGFNSGSHSWDVEVGANESWEIGVCEEMHERNRDTGNGCWTIAFYWGEYTAVSSSLPDDEIVLSVNQKTQSIRVHLDWDRGQLSFYDPGSNTHLHTFTHNFTHKLFPYFRNLECGGASMKVLPGRICVTVENHC